MISRDHGWRTHDDNLKCTVCHPGVGLLCVQDEAQSLCDKLLGGRYESDDDMRHAMSLYNQCRRLLYDKAVLAIIQSMNECTGYYSQVWTRMTESGLEVLEFAGRNKLCTCTFSPHTGHACDTCRHTTTPTGRVHVPRRNDSHFDRTAAKPAYVVNIVPLQETGIMGPLFLLTRGAPFTDAIRYADVRQHQRYRNVFYMSF